MQCKTFRKEYSFEEWKDRNNQSIYLKPGDIASRTKLIKGE